MDIKKEVGCYLHFEDEPENELEAITQVQKILPKQDAHMQAAETSKNEETEPIFNSYKKELNFIENHSNSTVLQETSQIVEAVENSETREKVPAILTPSQKELNCVEICSSSSVLETAEIVSESGHEKTFTCEESAYEKLGKLLIESTVVTETEAPSAPASSVLNDMFNLDLPCDKMVADIGFPQSFEDSIYQVFCKQQQLSNLKPFTAEQLVSFYENLLLEGEMAVVNSFLDCRKHLETHPLYDSLTYFLRSRIMLKSTIEELDQMNRDVEILASQMWTTGTKRVVEYSECSDSKKVKGYHDFTVAHINEKSSLQLIRQLQQQREKIQEKLVLSVYESHWWKLRVEWLICQGNKQSES